VIASFQDDVTADLFHGVHSAKVRKLPQEVQNVGLRKLDLIGAAVKLDDLKVPPGNRLEALKGSLAGYHSIRINDQWRIVFQWRDGAAHKVRIIDYHR
jgi:proteic killer suppression protein